MLILGLRLLLANVRSQEKELDKMRLRLAKQPEIRDCCTHRDLSPPQAFVLGRWTMFLAERVQDYSWMRRHRLKINHWCPHTVKVMDSVS